MAEGTIRLRVPSRTRPGVLHEVLLYPATGDVWCSCEDVAFAGPERRGERTCWHGLEALSLAGLGPPAPVSDPFAAFDRRDRGGKAPAEAQEAICGLGDTPAPPEPREHFTALPPAVFDATPAIAADLEAMRRAFEAGLERLEERSREVELAYLFRGNAPLELVDRMRMLRLELGQREAAAVELEELVAAGERRLGKVAA